MLVFVPRDTCRSVSWISRLVCRRRVGMLLVLAAAVALLLSLFSIHSKDYEVSAGPQKNLSFLDPVEDHSKLIIPPPSPAPPPTTTTTMVAKEPYAGGNNKTLSSFLGLWRYDVPAQHPCQNFLLAPPPPNMRRGAGPRPCPVCYVPVEHAAAVIPDFSSQSPVLKNLSYVSDEDFLLNKSKAGSPFGGQPSLLQRNESFDIQESMTVHCGFVKAKKPGHGTGFDIDDEDLLDMEQCYGVVIASAIFGNYDVLKQPKNISPLAKETACFYMFVDEETETYIKNTSMLLGSTKRIGLWRIVIVRNLPYSDPRRNGKVPKLLVHRLFPNARFSIWIDGKLELVVDPYQILERFLWRDNATFAISNHYRRFDVFDEAEANKAAAKYDNASIDYQIEFYKREGLTPYSIAKLPIISDVPEGCVIIREHIPITNLFTCLWFNEVDRFTSRDQLSFSTVRDKIMSKVDWKINMFMDCERRNFVVQAYHRDLLQRKDTSSSSSYPPPSSLPSESTAEKKITDSAQEITVKYPPIKNTSMKHHKERKSRPKRQHPKLTIAKDFPQM